MHSHIGYTWGKNWKVMKSLYITFEVSFVNSYTIKVQIQTDGKLFFTKTCTYLVMRGIFKLCMNCSATQSKWTDKIPEKSEKSINMSSL